MSRVHYYDNTYAIKVDINVLRELKAQIVKPQILSYTDTYDNDFIGYDRITWLYQIKSKEFGIKDMRSCLLKCSTEDIEWTKERNDKLTGIFYRKITFLPEIQSLLLSKLDEYLVLLEDLLAAAEAEDRKQREEKEAHRIKWSLVHSHTRTTPSGGELGVDGFIDAEYKNQNGTIIRMISRDVFDFGCYSYPQRLSGQEDALHSETWNDDERSLSKWLAEFGEFHGIRM